MPLITENDLRQHTGSLDKFSHWIKPVVFTEGVHYMAKEVNAFWVIDLIASYMSDILAGKHGEEVKYMSFWKFTFAEDNTCIVTCDDGNGNICNTQDIGFTDWLDRSDIKELMLYAQWDERHMTIMAPSEY